MATNAVNLNQLPKPTKYGDYWLGGKPGSSDYPAIIKIKAPDNPDRGKYMITTPEYGTAWDKENPTRLLAFSTPEMALAWLKVTYSKRDRRK